MLDALVIGSGFGGAFAALRLAERGMQVCVLERGKDWPFGSFPRSPSEVRRAFWDPSQGVHGLFDVWSFRRMAAVVASGVGGGSLLWSNVCLRKDDFEGWPITRDDLEPHYDRVEALLGATPYPDHAEYANTPKTRAFMRIPGAHKPKLAIAFGARAGDVVREEVPNRYGLTRISCKLTGECNVGCNLGSKNTLDLTVLSRAERAGASILSRAEVRSIVRDGDGFRVRFVRHADEAAPTRVLPEQELAAKRVIVAAGALGSTRLLLRSRLGVELPMLGHRMSGNGDALSYVWKASEALEPTRGPVITVNVPGRGFHLQDAGFPAWLAWIVEATQLDVASRAAGLVGRVVASWLGFADDAALSGAFARAFGEAKASGHSLPILGMGMDASDGVATLDERERLQLEWRIDASAEHFARVREASRAIAAQLGGELHDDPLDWISRAITVHPLGGCSMGVDANDGVVDGLGRVFGVPNLYVLDGAAMRGAVGANPALTIAAFADRAAAAITRVDT